jgi:hypothetical protein
VTLRAPLAVSLAVTLLALGGCAGRYARLGGDPATAARPRAVARPGESGYASFGRSVRLRTDTPSLTALEEQARGPEMVDPGVPAWAETPAGPAGDSGVSSWYDPWATANGWGVVAPGYGYGMGYGTPGYAPGNGVPGSGVPGYGAPGGAVPPGLREPSALTTPYHRAFPNSDVTYHRPGLSTGTGIYGRDAQDAARWPNR